MTNFKNLIAILLLLVYCNTCLSLECYVCHRQDGNVEKCLNTIKTCEQGEDVCMTEIEWGSPPYWSQGATKQYYVSKNCSTRERCHQIRKNNMDTCTHIWYEDWKCSDCCMGDRCNYYIISGSNSNYRSKIIISIILSVLLMFKNI